MLTQSYHILSELSLLKLHHASGIFVSPNEGSLLKWSGLISIRSGYYFGGVFSFVLELPRDFPSRKIPSIYLPKQFYHPHVDKHTGEVDFSKCWISEWNPMEHHLWQLLHQLKYLLTNPTNMMLIRQSENGTVTTATTSTDVGDQQTADQQFTEYANPIAAKDLICLPKDFDYNAKNCVKELSIWNLKNVNLFDQVNGLNVTGWMDDRFLTEARNQLLQFNESEINNPELNNSDCTTPGFSWVDPKTMSIFATEHSSSVNSSNNLIN